jgi:hypothetical protein
MKTGTSTSNVASEQMILTGCEFLLAIEGNYVEEVHIKVSQ